MMGEIGLGSHGSGCNIIISLSVSKNCEEFLDHLRDLKLIKKGYAPWNHSVSQTVSQSVNRSVRPLVTKLDVLKNISVNIRAYINVRLVRHRNTLFLYLLISSYIHLIIIYIHLVILCRSFPNMFRLIQSHLHGYGSKGMQVAYICSYIREHCMCFCFYTRFSDRRYSLYLQCSAHSLLVSIYMNIIYR
jgi:hypothetical protein